MYIAKCMGIICFGYSSNLSQTLSVLGDDHISFKLIRFIPGVVSDEVRELAEYFGLYATMASGCGTRYYETTPAIAKIIKNLITRQDVQKLSGLCSRSYLTEDYFSTVCDLQLTYWKNSNIEISYRLRDFITSDYPDKELILYRYRLHEISYYWRNLSIADMIHCNYDKVTMDKEIEKRAQFSLT